MSKNDKDYAVVLGIDHYPHLRPLNAAASDAARFVTWLLDPNGGNLPLDNVRMRKAPRPVRDATGAVVSTPDPIVPGTFEDDLVSLGVRKLGFTGRRFYFYFAGHGLAGESDDAVMLMSNATETRLNSHYSFRAINDWLRKFARFEELVFVIDCCRDYSNEIRAQGLQFSDGVDQVNAGNVRPYAVLATGYGGKAQEPVINGGAGNPEQEERRGLLTMAVLEALKEKKALDAEHRVTFSSLAEYVRVRVPALAKLHGRIEQEAAFRDPTRAPLILYEAKKDAAPLEALAPGSASATGLVRVTVRAEAGIEGELILLDGVLNELSRWPDAKATWQLELPPSLYAIRHVASGKRELFGVEAGQEQVDVTVR